MYQHLPLQEPPKFIHIEIFGFKICHLATLFQNSEGERKKSFGEIITEDFQRRYASKVIDLANINRDLNEHLRNIQSFTQQVLFELLLKYLS
jgi:hypothetical protein